MLGLSEEYQSQIESLYILHTLFRIETAMLWVNFSKKEKDVVISSLLAILDCQYPNWRDNKIIRKYQEKNLFFRFTMSLTKYFSVDEYRFVDVNCAKYQIKKVLEK